ncbi:hypothetical protein LOCUS_34640 [Klebsiella pneumoniae]|nr:hypothetical protein LOCUS_34640 [Klebsiella pneumoniae]GMX16193.1 hypothetical protein LOCUS_20520 [Klebsiella pneumoniae]
MQQRGRRRGRQQRAIAYRQRNRFARQRLQVIQLTLLCIRINPHPPAAEGVILAQMPFAIILLAVQRHHR